MDFPIINSGYAGQEYDHYWGVGFGELQGDRLYHVKYSTKERHVWQTAGYSPSEPVMIQNPFIDQEDEGVLISLAAPFNDYNAKTPFF